MALLRLPDTGVSRMGAKCAWAPSLRLGSDKNS
uniref:Uncharacterized protein n=1 Tax=Amphimedon queenslandica TaxID=400682 RepID=A0A1X7U3S8_AMPQE